MNPKTTSTVQVTEHFTLKDLVFSDTAARLGISNTVSSSVLDTAHLTAVRMEVVRELLGASIRVNSWCRSSTVNEALGSKESSQHLRGEAVDFTCPIIGTPYDICKLLVANTELIGFDQLILEHSWVHISFAILSGKPRHQVLSLLSTGGYAQGLTDRSGKSY